MNAGGTPALGLKGRSILAQGKARSAAALGLMNNGG